MAARTVQLRRPSQRTTMLLLGLTVVTGVAVLWVGPALAEPSPAPGPAPGPSGTTSTPTSPPDAGPTAPATPAPIPDPSAPPSNPASGNDPAWYEIGGQIRKAVVDLVVWAADQALQPVMEALGKSWLSTPDFTSSDAVQGFWTTSLVLANSVFVLFIVAGGFLLASRETLQTRHGLKQVLPRLAVGAVAANCSLIICQKAIEWTNALTVAFTANSVDGPTASAAIRQLVDNALRGEGFLMALLVIAVIVMCLVLEITFVLRLAALILLTGIAPAALICHASPLTEGIAHTWWRAFTACLGLQLGQAIVVLATVKVFLTPAGPTVMGIPATGDGLLGVLVCLTMLWVLIKLPSWMKQYVLGPLGQGGGRSLLSQIVNAYLAIKSLGAASGVLRAVGAARAAGTAGRATTARGGGARSPRALPGRSRPAPAGPAAFSHAPVTHTPLPSPVGTNAAPTFSHASNPAEAISSAAGAVSAVRFSHPSPPETPRPAPVAPAGRVAFSDATPAAPRRADGRPAQGVSFSAAPAAPATGRPRRTASPAIRPTAARRATPGRASGKPATPPTPPARTPNASTPLAMPPTQRRPAPSPSARPGVSPSRQPLAGPATPDPSSVAARPASSPPPIPLSPPSRPYPKDRGDQR
jgi:hypothetical protein